MILQEINFYRHFKPKKTSGSFLTWKRFWGLNVIVIILLTFIYIASIVEVIYLRNKNQSLQKELVTYQSKFDAIKKTFPQLFFSDNIDESVASLKQEIAAQEKIVDILSERDSFSDNLIALSKAILPSLWLTRIQILKNGDDITLYGNSKGIHTVNSFIKNLGINDIYSKYNISIQTLKNTKNDEANPYINFELRLVMKDE